jgi:hypothetical protein
MIPIERDRRKTAKAMLGALALLRPTPHLKLKNCPDFIPVQRVWRTAKALLNQLFPDVVPALTFARCGKLDGSTKHLKVFFASDLPCLVPGPDLSV